MIKYKFKHYQDKPSYFYYIKNFLSNDKQNELIEYLDKMNDFQPCTNYRGQVNRYQKWYQKDNKYFCPTWKHRYPRWESFSYDKKLNEIQLKISNKLKKMNILDNNFNSCLINKYVNGDDYIHFHRDSITSFGEYPLIVGLSIGSEREIKFRKVIFNRNNLKSIKSDKENPIKFKIKLESGSLFIMRGSSQKYFGHEINTSDTEDVRYSLTFRNFIL